MTLRTKVLLLVGATVLGLFAIMLGISLFIVLRGFAEQEQTDARRDTERILSALRDDLSNLGTTTKDWSGWDDAYLFVQDRNQQFVESNLSDDTTFTNTRLNVMVFLDLSGTIVFAEAYDPALGRRTPIPDSLRKHLEPGALLLRHPDPDSRIDGLLVLPEGPLLVSSQPILTSKREGPSRGTVVFGRFLNQGELQALAQTVQFPLALYRPADPGTPADVLAVLPTLSDETPIQVLPLNDQTVAVYAALKDVYSEQALVLRAEMSREGYARGRATVWYALLSLLAAGLVCGALTLVALNRLVLARVSRLSAEVRDIGSQGGASARVSMPAGADELTDLGTAINGMLEAVERAQQERTRAEQALHLAEREALEAAKLRELDRLKNELLSTVSHELRTPLTLVHGYSELLAVRTLDTERMREMAREIHRGSEVMSRLVDDLVDFTRIQRGHISLEMKEVDLANVVRQAATTLAGRPGGERIVVQLPTAPMPALIDPQRVSQIVGNLVSNALRYAPSGPIQVRLRAEPDGRALLEVQDGGPGLAAESIDRVWEMFYRAPDAVNSPVRGAGIGLAVVKHLVEGHGGSVGVRSIPGQGATFLIYLPIRAAVPGAVPAAPNPGAAPVG